MKPSVTVTILYKTATGTATAFYELTPEHAAQLANDFAREPHGTSRVLEVINSQGDTVPFVVRLSEVIAIS